MAVHSAPGPTPIPLNLVLKVHESVLNLVLLLLDRGLRAVEMRVNLHRPAIKDVVCITLLNVSDLRNLA